MKFLYLRHRTKNSKRMTTFRFLAGLFFSFMTFSVFGQIGEDFKVPETWAKDFIISLSYHSSMSGGKTTIKFTFDSCTYLNQQSHSKKPSKLRTYKMREEDRVAILKRLTELKADEIKSESSVHAVHDGWSQSICFGFHCIEGGTSAEMTEEDKNSFLDTYRFLEEFAIKKAK